MKKIIYIGLSVIASTAIANFSMADNLEEVIITSSLIDASASELSNPIHVLDAQSINGDATQSIGSLIDGLMGVSSSDFGAAVGQPVIRGLSVSRVKLLNNGKVVRDITSLGPDHANETDLGLLEQIEIIKGPSSLLYANGAVGGIVNIVDNSIAKQDIESFKFNVGAGYEDGNGGDTGSASFVGNIGGINVTSSVQYSDLGNYAIPEGAVIEAHKEDHEEEEEHDHDANTLENSDFTKTGYKLGLSKIEDWGYIGLSYADSSSTYGIPFHGDNHEDEHGDEHGDGHGDHEGERIFANTDSETINFEGSYNFNGGLVKRADYYIRSTSYVHTEQHAEEHHEEEEEGHQEHGPTLFKNDSNEFGLTLEMGSDTNMQKLNLNITQEEVSIDGEEKFLEPTKSDEMTLGYFVSHELNAAHIDFGVRVDQIERTSIDGNYDDTLTSFSTTISPNIAGKVDVSLGLSSVQKAPSASELFMGGDHLVTQLHEIGDSTLSNERANNIDLNFETTFAGFDTKLNLYRNDISNFIYLAELHNEEDEDTPFIDAYLARKNKQLADIELTLAGYKQQDAIFEGYELELSRSIALKNGNLDVSLGRDYVDAQFKDGDYIPRTVPTRNILNLNYKANNGLNLLVSIKDVQKQSKVAVHDEEEEHEGEEEGEEEHHDHGEIPTDGFQWVNLSLSKEIKTSDTESLTVSFFAKNLLNKVARNHTSFVKDEVPLPGRNLGLKVNYNF